MVTGRTAGHTFDLSGGDLCLDFANTVSNRGSEQPADHLGSYDDLLAWAEQSGATAVRAARALRRRAAAHPSGARQAFARAIALREALYRLFAAVAAGRKPPPDDLDALNTEVPSAYARSRLAAADGRFVLTADAAPDDLTAPMVPVIRSAVDLLTSSASERVRVCADDTCEWLFLDTTKNRTRRWCDMKVCGNRAKVRRFRQRRT